MNSAKKRSNKRTQMKMTKSASKKGIMSLGPKPHHSVTIRSYFTMNVNESSASEFHAYAFVKPYDILTNSAWNPLVNIYEKMRVRAYNVHMYLPRQSIVDKGRVVAFLERDSVPSPSSAPVWPYGKLLEMPGRKESNNLVSKIGFQWNPIDAEDYDYKVIDSSYDNDTYGLLLYAGFVGTPITTKPIYEIQITLDFVDLLTAPSLQLRQAQAAPTAKTGWHSGGEPSGQQSFSYGTEYDDDDVTVVPDADDIQFLRDEVNSLKQQLASLTIKRPP